MFHEIFDILNAICFNMLILFKVAKKVIDQKEFRITW